jgi:hypothetical protein
VLFGAVKPLLYPKQIEKAYLDYPLRIPELWNLSRKHFRVETFEGKFVKLNKFVALKGETAPPKALSVAGNLGVVSNE